MTEDSPSADFRETPKSPAGPMARRTGRTLRCPGAARRLAGFTLLEMVAVIIILAVLAAVAVPKFFAMQETARQTVLNGALAEATARFHHAYNRFILDKYAAPGDVAGFLDRAEYLGVGASDTAAGVVMGDFTVAWTRRADGALVIEVIDARTISDFTGLQTTKVIENIQWAS